MDFESKWYQQAAAIGEKHKVSLSFRPCAVYLFFVFFVVLLFLFCFFVCFFGLFFLFVFLVCFFFVILFIFDFPKVSRRHNHRLTDKRFFHLIILLHRKRKINK